MKNAIENDIRTGSSSKGYIHGFKGFVDVVSRIKNKLTKKISTKQGDSWAVDAEHSDIPKIEQIQDKIIGTIK